MTITIKTTNGQTRAIPNVRKFNCDGDTLSITKEHETQEITFNIEDILEITVN